MAAARLGYALSVFSDELKLMGKALRSKMLVPVQVNAQGRRIRRRIKETADTFTYANYQVEELGDHRKRARGSRGRLRDIPPDLNFVRPHVALPPVIGRMLEQRVDSFWNSSTRNSGPKPTSSTPHSPCAYSWGS
jgi:hypothetical protein